ncbi:MAG: 50S ribosomal protein L4 [Clostridia bacterium]|nr:50S ribosomal protein L4 [Clostridia bacterium]
MPKVKVYNTKAEIVGQITLSDEVFGCEYNEPLIHQVVVAFNNNQRQGTKSTLLRSEVRGHAKKPWKQKGTGRARQGSTKSAQWKGGGIIFAPKPRDFSQKINKSMKVSAFKSAISAKVADNEVFILENLSVEQPKTKLFNEILNSFEVGSKNVMFVLSEKDENIIRAVANIPNVHITYADVLGTYNIVSNTKLYITKDAINKIEEAYKQ